MYSLLYAPTPNGHKITLMLEALAVDYRIIPINIMKGDQFLPSFLRISPNNRMPALIDHATGISVFESGAILTYLAETHQRFLPAGGAERYQVLEWLFWQMGGLGPMAGQANHFNRFAPEVVPYAIKRYTEETARLYGVVDRQLQGKDYVAGAYSIADMAIFPWLQLHEMQQQDLALFPNIRRYLAAMEARPDVVRALAKAGSFDWSAGFTDEQLQGHITFNGEGSA
ncbi:MAG TPA: glutathione S-transferase N-terminal domain-containing protein [Spongiibacteraceae bacterium]|nr:glutathione S-transferase N-terminal domain-containing protein [Spongiibacteraceae bacterium]